MATSNDPEKARALDAALELLRGHTKDNPINTWELVQSIKRQINTNRTEKQIYYDILESSKDNKSNINSRKGPGGGYYLSDILPEEGTSESDRILKKEKTYEKHLYPVVKEWFRSEKGIESKSIPNKRKGGTWVNPDLICWEEIRYFGIHDIELYAVEVKTSLYKWKQFFFQAVAYKEISNRVYFFYRDNGDVKDSERTELIRYAERYGVGVIEAIINDDYYNLIQDYSSLSDVKKVSINNNIIERLPAPFAAISAVDKVALLKRFDIRGERGSPFLGGLNRADKATRKGVAT